MTMQNSEDVLPNLHDALLLSIEIDWKKGTTTIPVRGSKVTGRLVATGTTRVECPREFPWGRSECILDATIHSPTAETSELHIQMQSGDVLIVHAETIVFHAQTQG